MMKHSKTKDVGKARALLTGLLAATLSFFAFMLFVTLILYLGDDPTYKSELWSFGAMLLSGVVAGAINAHLRGGGVMIAVFAALALVLLLFIIGVIFVGLPSLPSIVNYAIYVAVSAVAAFFALQKPKKRHRR